MTVPREPKVTSPLTMLTAWVISTAITYTIAILFDLHPLVTALVGVVLGGIAVYVVHEIRWNRWFRQYKQHR